MSISGISGMTKALSSFEGIGSALRESDDFMGGITEAISSITRTYSPMLTNDEVKLALPSGNRWSVLRKFGGHLPTGKPAVAMA